MQLAGGEKTQVLIGLYLDLSACFLILFRNKSLLIPFFNL